MGSGICRDVGVAEILKSLDAWGFKIFHLKATIINLGESSIEPTQKFEHLLFVSFLLFLIEPAGLTVGVKLVVRRIEMRDFEVNFAKILVIIYDCYTCTGFARLHIARPDGPLKIIEQ